MTNEEAIKILSDARTMLIKANAVYGIPNSDFEEAKEAYDLAIRALEEVKPPKTDYLDGWDGEYYGEDC